MKFAIIGAGAIGRLFGGLLSRANHDVILITRRKEAADEIRKKGIIISTQRWTERINVEASMHLNGLRERELIMLAVKSYETATVTRWISTRLREDSVLLTLQNGIGNVEAIESLLPGFQLVGGSTTTGASLLDNGIVLWTGKGETVIGEHNRKPSTLTKNLAKTLSSTGIQTTTTFNLQTTLWRKALINAGINPVTALLRITNGELIRDSEAFLISSKAVEEGLRVANAEGARLQTNLVGEMRIVAQETADNRSSMLQDVEKHRKTEIDMINGAIVEFGRKHSIPTPINEILWASIKSLEPTRKPNSKIKIPAEA